MARFDFSGKVALIAGASRGIGAAVAHGFAEHGATVICSSRKQADCEKVAEAIRDKGGKAVSCELHLGKLDHHDAALSMIEKEFGRLDVLVNNGATSPHFGPAHEASAGAFDKTIEVNTRGPYFLSTKAFPLLKADGGGSIVSVASIDGIQPAEFRVIYGMSKAALIAMTKGLAKEYSQPVSYTHLRASRDS